MWRKLLYPEENSFESPVKKIPVDKMTEEEVKLLVHKRGLVKAKVTRIRSALKAPEEDHTKITFAQLRVYSKSLENHYREFNEVHDVLLSTCGANQRESQEKKYEEFETLYNETSLAIESLKDAKTPAPALLGNTSSCVTRCFKQCYQHRWHKKEIVSRAERK